MFRNLLSLAAIILLFLQFSNAHWWQEVRGISLNQANFFQHIGQEKNVFVEFFTPWCIYCQQMSGDWSRLADYYHDNQESRKDIIIAKLNCQDSQDFCAQMHIHSFPAIRFFPKKQNKAASQFQGYRYYDAFVQWIEDSAGPYIKPEPPQPVIQQAQDQQQQEEQIIQQPKEGNDQPQQQQNQQQSVQIQSTEEDLQKKEEEKEKQLIQQQQKNDIEVEKQIETVVQKEQQPQEQQQQKNQSEQQVKTENQPQDQTKSAPTVAQTDNQPQDQQQHQQQLETKEQKQEQLAQKIISEDIIINLEVEKKLGEIYKEIRTIKKDQKEFQSSQDLLFNNFLIKFKNLIEQETHSTKNFEKDYIDQITIIHEQQQHLNNFLEQNKETATQNAEEVHPQNNNNTNQSALYHPQINNLLQHFNLFQCLLFLITGAFIGMIMAFCTLRNKNKGSLIMTTGGENNKNL